MTAPHVTARLAWRDSVRLRSGLGALTRDAVALPPVDASEFSIAAAPGRDARHFHLVDERTTVAVFGRDRDSGFDAQERAACQLRAAGVPIAVFISDEAEGAAIARCYSGEPDPFNDAACALWAVKALGGWEECPRMTFGIKQVTAIDHSEGVTRVSSAEAWLTVRGTLHGGQWSADVWHAMDGGWRALLARLDECRDRCAVILVDIDWLMAFNDAYGHESGDLLLARIYGAIEASVAEHGATVARVAGDEFAVVIAGTSESAMPVAEAIRGNVESLRIPFTHAEVRTDGHVTVSVGIADNASRDVRAAAEDAVYAAKRAGRNRIAVAPRAE